MNILYLCDEYPPGQHGGIGTSVRLLARQMVKQGHTVVVAGLYPLGYGEDDLYEDKGVKVYRFRMGLDSPWFRDHHSLRVRLGKRLLKYIMMMQWDIKRSLANYQKQLEQIIDEYQIEIIEMPDYNDYVKLCRSFVPFPALSVPIVVKLHSSVTFLNRESGMKVPRQIFRIEQSILNGANAVLAVSKYTAAKSASYFAYPGKIDVIHNGIDTGLPISTIAKQPKQVIYTGSLMPKKGIYQLAKAWNMVHKNVPDAQLLVLGKGSAKAVLRFLSPEAANTVSFLGYVETAQLYRHLAASAISVFPSYIESFALAPLEAMACGTCVINTNRASGAELIDDGVNGLLVDPDNVEQIASAIIRLLNNADECSRLAKNGMQKVKDDFAISKIADQNLAFYQRVLENV